MSVHLVYSEVARARANNIWLSFSPGPLWQFLAERSNSYFIGSHDDGSRFVAGEKDEVKHAALARNA